MAGFFNAKRGEGIRSLFFRTPLSPLHLSKNSIQGMDGEEEAEGLQLMLEHKGFGIRGEGRRKEEEKSPPAPLFERGENIGRFSKGGRDFQ